MPTIPNIQPGLARKIRRRQVLQGTLALAGAALFPFARLSVGMSTPDEVRAGVDVRDLTITVSDSGLNFPASIPGGRYLVTVNNPREEGITVTFIQPPAGKTAADLQQATRGEQDPAWLYDAISLGGPYARAEDIAQGIVDLTPGAWLVSGGQSLAGPAQWLTVTADATPLPMSPDASLTIGLQEYGFSGLESAVAPGPQIWAFANRGDQPHLMDLVRIARPVTVSEVIEFLGLPEDAEPTPGNLSADEVVGVAGIGATSPDQTTWLVLPDLVPGTYAAMCFVPDRTAGVPHAAMGMVQVFTVADAAPPTADAPVNATDRPIALVDIRNFTFMPASIQVAAGQTVTWTNHDTAPHTVTGDSGGDLASGTVAAGATFSHTFTAAGEVAYHCEFHPSIIGSVVVQ